VIKKGDDMFSMLPDSALKLKDSILSESINCLKINTFFDNFDAERFNFDGADRSKTFNTQERVYWLSWFYENYERLFEAFDILRGDRSRRLFLNIIAYRIAGHHSVKINTRFDETSDEFAAYSKCEIFTPSIIPTHGDFGSLKHYDFIYDGKRYTVDCLGLKYYLFRKQYFFEDRGTVVKPEIGEFVIDAGACLGDSAVVFAKAVGPEGRVYAFDPVESHIEVLNHNSRQIIEDNINVMPFGLSDSDVVCPPIKIDTYNPGFSSLNQKVPLRALDSLIKEAIIPRVDFIKMDIEGAELSAIKGSERCIRRFHPKLAISLYHKPNDIFEIPLYIAREFPFYEMYIDHYTIHNEETVLYCKPISSP
jgi:FkbM family methyltransferase